MPTCTQRLPWDPECHPTYRSSPFQDLPFFLQCLTVWSGWTVLWSTVSSDCQHPICNKQTKKPPDMFLLLSVQYWAFRWLSSKESTCNAGDADLIPGSGGFPGGGNGNPLQYSCLGNLKKRGVWRATVHGVTNSRTQLSTHMHTCR